MEGLTANQVQRPGFMHINSLSPIEKADTYHRKSNNLLDICRTRAMGKAGTLPAAVEMEIETELAAAITGAYPVHGRWHTNHLYSHHKQSPECSLEKQ